MTAVAVTRWQVTCNRCRAYKLSGPDIGRAQFRRRLAKEDWAYNVGADVPLSMAAREDFCPNCKPASPAPSEGKPDDAKTAPADHPAPAHGAAAPVTSPGPAHVEAVQAPGLSAATVPAAAGIRPERAEVTAHAAGRHARAPWWRRLPEPSRGLGAESPRPLEVPGKPARPDARDFAADPGPFWDDDPIPVLWPWFLSVIRWQAACIADSLRRFCRRPVRFRRRGVTPACDECQPCCGCGGDHRRAEQLDPLDEWPDPTTARFAAGVWLPATLQEPTSRETAWQPVRPVVRVPVSERVAYTAELDDTQADGLAYLRWALTAPIEQVRAALGTQAAA